MAFRNRYSAVIYTDDCERQFHFEAVDSDAAWDIALSEAFREGLHVGVGLEDTYYVLGYRKTSKVARDWVAYEDMGSDVPWLYKLATDFQSFHVHVPLDALPGVVESIIGDHFMERPMYYACAVYPVTESRVSLQSWQTRKIINYTGFLEPASEEKHKHQWRNARVRKSDSESWFSCRCGAMRTVHWEIVNGVNKYVGLTTDHRRRGARKSVA